MIIDQQNSQLIRELLGAESDLTLNSMRDYADKHHIPILQRETQAFIKQLLILHKPRTILELGTAIGYSAVFILKCCKSANLITVEREQALVELAKVNLSNAKLSDRARVILGDLDEVLPKIHGGFDFIFCDANKSRYPLYFEHLYSLLNEGGILVCDNVLFGGRIADKTLQIKKSITITRGIEKFLPMICNHKGLSTSILPLGDGISVSIKVEENG